MVTDWEATKVGPEAGKAITSEAGKAFLQQYLRGGILDIGYRGSLADAVPVTESATGVELDFPEYDGRRLPFPDGSQDTVFASHVLEHIPDSVSALREWLRVLRVGGHIVVCVPHQHLYEKRRGLPSDYNTDHKRFYTGASLLAEVEAAFAPNSYRVRHLSDNDEGYDYSVTPETHSNGSYEIRLSIQKLEPPSWELRGPVTAAGRLARRVKFALRSVVLSVVRAGREERY